MMDWLRSVVQDQRTERFIMALIVLNAVTLGLETSQNVMAKYGDVLVVIDRLIIGIFVAEILARLAVQRASFFRDGWNIFDVIVVGIALAPATAAFSGSCARSVCCVCCGSSRRCLRCSAWSAA